MRNLWVVPSEAARAEANSELREAAKAGDVEAVKAALRKGAKINQRFDYGLTALHFAAIYNHADVAAALVIAGAKTNLQTKDEAQATPAMLADASKNQAVLNVLGEKALLVNPLRRRFMGPTTISAVIIVNTILAFILTDPSLRWNGWKEATGDFLGGAASHRHLYLPLCVLSLLLLLLVNTKNPGFVLPAEVAYVMDLWNDKENPDRVDVDDENFGVVFQDGSTEVFTWCHSCKMWRPKNVSHCSICRRCCWRFDHHCAAVGTCIGAGNHLVFATFVVFASLSWMFCVASVSAHLYYHGGLDSLRNLNEAGLGDWPLYLYVPFAGVGAFCSSVLLSFGIFHTSTLFLNYNTKIVWKRKDPSSWCQLNSSEVMGQLFCAPCEFRACGAPEAFPLRHMEPGQGGPADVFSLHELCVPSKPERRKSNRSNPSSSGSDSENDSMV